MLPVEQPFKPYTGLDGKPLNNGFVYFGLPNQNPQTAPVTVYWDAAGTIPAAQPLKTVNGYIYRGGTPANVFFDGAYSELVWDSKHRQVFYAPTSDDFSLAAVVSGLTKPTGAAGIGYTQGGIGSITRTVQDKLRDTSISITDFGATTAASDNSAAILKAVSIGRSIYVPDGVWTVTAAVNLPGGAFIWGPGTIKRIGVGPIFTASSKTDITIMGIGLQGDQNSYALQFGGCKKVRILHNRCQDIMLVEMNSATAVYATTTDDNMSRDVVVYGNTGVCDTAPNAVSQQFIRMLYTRDFSVCLNTARGYRDLVLAWGGDFSTDGAAANARKCYDGLIEGNRGNVLAAGIWTGMAQRIRIVGNYLYGSAFAEGLDAEGSTDITFEANDAFNFADGMTVFGLNRNIRFKNNNIEATVNAFRNANSTFYADYGLIEFDGNSFKSLAAGACIGWVTGAAGRIRMTDNDGENVAVTMTDVAVADAIILDNEFYFDYAPSGLWFVRLGGLATGYTLQPKVSQFVFKRNLIQWRGAGISGKRALGLTSSAVAHLIDLQENTFNGIDEQVSYEGSTGAMTVLAKRNTFDVAATYPSVLHGSSDGLTVIWQDNDRSDGLDAYGTNTSAAMTASFFSTASRIWANTPTNGNTPGWIKRTGVFGPMASIG